MGKNKNRNKNQIDEEEQFGKKKKNIITQQLLMDKSNMDFTEFIPLLPEDVMYPPFKVNAASTKALLKIVTDMNYLLYLQPKSFWATVTYNITFNHCLSSCLSQLSVRWMNRYQQINSSSQQVSDFDSDINYRAVSDTQAYTYLQALQDVLLKVIYRIMSFQQEDHKLNEIYNFGENTIKKLNIFNLIKLNELVEIFGDKDQNHAILKVIAKNYLRTLNNPYKYFVQGMLPHIVKKMEQTNREVKLVTDRQEFGINYSYTRTNPKHPSPGEQQLKRKASILCTYISFLKLINNTKLINEQIQDNLYFNPQINFILQNAFYELDAAYKIWNLHGMEKRLQPMMNKIFVLVVGYFVEYFERVEARLVNRSSKQNVQAYAKSLQRLFVDYGKRYSLGKKGNTLRHMTLFKLILKRINLINIFQQLYLQQQQNKTYEFNMEFFIDFKLALEDCYKEDNYINEDELRQDEIEEETQLPDEDDGRQVVDQHQVLVREMKREGQEGEKGEKVEDLMYHKPDNQDKLEFLVSKKSREDDYYEQLYLKQRQRFKIQYEDQYDDLVDYDKRPLFMDSASSDSEPEEELKMQRLVSNQDNQKINQLKHNKFEEKQKLKKTQNKYSKVSHEEKATMIDKSQPQQKDDGKMKYVAKQKDYDRQKSTTTQEKSKYVPKQKDVQEEKKAQKPKGNNLESLLQQQKMPHDEDFEEDQQKGRGGQGGRGGRGGYKRRYNPQKTHDDKSYNDKGRNSNKNREHGNPTNQAFGGGKKYKAKY